MNVGVAEVCESDVKHYGQLFLKSKAKQNKAKANDKRRHKNRKLKESQNVRGQRSRENAGKAEKSTQT